MESFNGMSFGVWCIFLKKILILRIGNQASKTRFFFPQEYANIILILIIFEQRNQFCQL